jgi:hypothetical protein
MNRTTQTRVLLVCAALLSVALIGLWTATPSVLSADDKAQNLADDGANAKVMKFDNLQDVRYTEIWLISPNPKKEELSGVFYNTTGLNNTASPKDSSPQTLLDKVDPEALKKQFGVAVVFKNGPRYWCYDWIELPVGAERDFDGLKARWFGTVNLPKDFGKKKGSTAYHPTTVGRKSKQGYAKGQSVFILDDPQGTPWVMQAYSRIVDPKLSWDDLKTLSEKLKLPEGWKYRVKVLDQDLNIGAIKGHARVVQDDLENTYNACFEQNGEKNYNFKP